MCVIFMYIEHHCNIKYKYLCVLDTKTMFRSRFLCYISSTYRRQIRNVRIGEHDLNFNKY